MSTLYLIFLLGALHVQITIMGNILGRRDTVVRGRRNLHTHSTRPQTKYAVQLSGRDACTGTGIWPDRENRREGGGGGQTQEMRRVWKYVVLFRFNPYQIIPRPENEGLSPTSTPLPVPPPPNVQSQNPRMDR